MPKTHKDSNHLTRIVVCMRMCVCVVTASQIGLWGWSYGGFMASHVITANSSAIAMTMAVAPVTQWEYYDSAYTERYMQTPATNAFGYSNTSVLSQASAISEQAHFLLVHGTADDNVHLQNSAVFSTNLVAAGVSFDQMYYTDKNHAIAGTDTRKSLYKKLADFVAASYGLPMPSINIRPTTRAKRQLQSESSSATAAAAAAGHNQDVQGYHWKRTAAGQSRKQREHV
jgi:dienelactone hydrolase